MGENLAADGRLAVRTPMQWTDGKNGGFSAAAASRLPGPVVEGGFAPEHVNVQAQRKDPDSLLSFITLLTRRYRECPELGWGSFEVVEQPHAAVLVHRCTWHEAQLVAVHNLGPEPVTVPLRLPDLAGTVLADLLCDGDTTVGGDGRADLLIESYGYRWLRVVRDGERRLR